MTMPEDIDALIESIRNTVAGYYNQKPIEVIRTLYTQRPIEEMSQNPRTTFRAALASTILREPHNLTPNTPVDQIYAQTDYFFAQQHAEADNLIGLVTNITERRR
jgi:hypothetical protein